MRSMVIRPVLGIVVALSGMAGAHAGQYLDVMNAGGLKPIGLNGPEVRESSLNWDCSNGVSCALTGPLQAAVVFTPDSTLAQGFTSHSAGYSVFVEARTVDNILDPLGHSWSISADMGKWRIGVDIASQTPQGADPQFASAYGRFSYTVRPSFFFPPGQETTGSVLLGLQGAPGAVTFGPGSQGLSLLDEQGRYPEEDGSMFAFPWRFSTQLEGTRRAYPSMTDTQCSSTTCMDYKTDLIKVNNYFLSFDLVAVQTAVPEVSSSTMMLAGLAGLGWAVCRRQNKKA